MNDIYLIRAAIREDLYGQHWLGDVSADDGHLTFAITTDVKKAMRLSRRLALAIAAVGSSERYLLQPVPLEAIELAKVMTAAQI